MNRPLLLASTLMVTLTLGCAARQGAILAPEGRTAPQASAEKLARLRVEAGASFHLLRVERSSPTRTFAQNDLVMFIMGGRGRLQLGREDYAVSVGDVIEIPRETSFSLVQASSEPCTAYLVITPPFEGTDDQLVGQRTGRTSAWHWTRWGR